MEFKRERIRSYKTTATAIVATAEILSACTSPTDLEQESLSQGRPTEIIENEATYAVDALASRRCLAEAALQILEVAVPEEYEPPADDIILLDTNLQGSVYITKPEEGSAVTTFSLEVTKLSYAGDPQASLRGEFSVQQNQSETLHEAIVHTDPGHVGVLDHSAAYDLGSGRGGVLNQYPKKSDVCEATAVFTVHSQN